MPYKFISSEPSLIVLERNSTQSSSIVFAVLGAMFFLVGIAMNILIDDNDVPFIIFKILFPLIGLGFVILGIRIPSITRKTTPELITFDNKKGTVSIEMTLANGPIGYIRYDEIEKFDIYTEARSSSSSSGKSSGVTTYYYHTFLQKKDGGEWFLTESSSYQKAEENLKKLTAEVQLQNPCTLRSSATFSDKLLKDETSGKTVIRWQNKVSFLGVAALVVFMIVFMSILSTVFANKNFRSSFDVFPIIIVGIIFLVFCFIMFIVIKQLVKDATTIYCIVIDKTQLEYQELTKAEVLRNSKILALKDIHCIAYSFSPLKDYGLGSLRIMTQKHFDQLALYKEKPVEVIKDLFKKKDSALTFSINAFNPVEYLQLENWLQEHIHRKGNVEVL